MLSGLHAQDIAFLFVSLLIGVTVHEMMHGLVAYRLGDTTAADMGRLTLNPLRSIDPLTTIVLPLIMIVTIGVPFFAAKPVPFNPARVKWEEFGAALVGLAGPAANLVLAVIGGGLVRLLAATGGYAANFFYWFVWVNVGLMVFNLIPFPPLDGSRLLYAVAPEPLRDIMARIESFGFLAILVFIIILFQFISPLVVNIDSHLVFWLTGAGV